MRSFIVLISLFLLISVSAPFIGPNAGEAQSWVFWQLRVPRLLCALVAGGSLAVCGATFQALFRNPLATPFTLGTASGAALGASLLLFLAPGTTAFLAFFPAISPLVFVAFVGALASLGMVFLMVRFSLHTTDTDILLAGVAVSFLFSSLIMLLQYLSDPTQTVRMLRWTMGSLERGGGYVPILTLLPWAIPALSVLVYHHRELDLLCMGSELAQARGVATSRVRFSLLLTVSLLTASVVSVCGPISFLGLMIPHIMRRLMGSRHITLLPATFLGGGLLLVSCDTFSRTIIFPDELPVGILTALLGGPFFLAQIVTRSHGKQR